MVDSELGSHAGVRLLVLNFDPGIAVSLDFTLQWLQELQTVHIDLNVDKQNVNQILEQEFN